MIIAEAAVRAPTTTEDSEDKPIEKVSAVFAAEISIDELNSRQIAEHILANFKSPPHYDDIRQNYNSNQWDPKLPIWHEQQIEVLVVSPTTRGIYDLPDESYQPDGDHGRYPAKKPKSEGEYGDEYGMFGDGDGDGDDYPNYGKLDVVDDQNAEGPVNIQEVRSNMAKLDGDYADDCDPNK